MFLNIKAVVFDIDGTLYPEWKFVPLIFPFALKHIQFMRAFGVARKSLRQQSCESPPVIIPDFFKAQAQIIGAKTGKAPKDIQRFIDTEIYRGWKQYFEKIPLFPHVKETFISLKQHGYKIGILSDFLPEQKGSLWGLLPLCDVVLGSEQVGALKPSPLPFIEVAHQLHVSVEHILYVGNNARVDIQGARNAGMKTAAIQHPVYTALKRNKKGADIFFSGYRQFLKKMI